jgi:eukaryotic-like serine/threonine-protein kinase
MPPHEAPASLEAANTLIAIANWHLEKGRWEMAAQRFFALVHVFTSVDMRDTEANSREWMPAATAISEWGMPGQYEEFRRLAIRRFASSGQSTVAEHLLKVTLLQPADPETLEALAPLGAILEATVEGPKREKNAHLVAWRQMSLALLAYRQGHWKAAAHRAGLALESRTPERKNRAVMAGSILAMARIHEGDLAAAQISLKELRAQVEEWEMSPLHLQEDQRIGWSNWGAARILLREAEALLAAASASAEI